MGTGRFLGVVCALTLSLACFGCGGSPATSDDTSKAPQQEEATEQAQEASTEQATEKDSGLSDADAKAVAEGMTCKYITTYYKTFGEALTQANQNGGGTVTLLSDSTLTSDGVTPMVTFRINITVKSAGSENFTVKRGAADTGTMLQITDGVVTVKNATFDGAGTNSAGPVFLVSDLGRLILEDGSIVTGNASSAGASAVEAVGASAFLELRQGATISQCAASGDALAAVVSDGGDVTNDGATFTGNTTASGSNSNYAEKTVGKFAGTAISAS